MSKKVSALLVLVTFTIIVAKYGPIGLQAYRDSEAREAQEQADREATVAREEVERLAAAERAEAARRAEVERVATEGRARAKRFMKEYMVMRAVRPFIEDMGKMHLLAGGWTMDAFDEALKQCTSEI